MSPQPNGPRARFHAFLRRLRAKGRSNMYGAVPYLMQAFELGRDDAFRIVCEWIDAQEQETAAPSPQGERPRQRTPRVRRVAGKRRRTTS
jgi:hypothetical protein